MRTSIFTTLIALLPLATATTLYTRQTSTPPDCATQCLTQIAANPPAGCSITDTACICQSNDLITQYTSCIDTGCTDPTDLASAISFAEQYYAAAGVTINPGSSSSSTDDTTASSTASITLVQSSIASAASSIQGSASSAIASITSSIGSAVSAASSSASASASSAHSALSSSIASSKSSNVSSASASSSSAANATKSSGARGEFKVGTGLLGAAFGLVLVL